MKETSRRSRFWDLTAFFYEQFFGRFPPHRNLFKEIMKHVGDPSSSPEFFLDAGCGPGLLSLQLAQRGHKVLGIDRSPEMIKRARKIRRRIKKAPLFFIQADLNEGVGIRKESLRRILMVHSLYLMNDPGKVLYNLALALSADGEIIMCNPCRRMTPAELWDGGKLFLANSLREDGALSIFFFLPIVLVMGGLHFVIQFRKKRIYHCWDEKGIKEVLKAGGLRLKWAHRSCNGNSHLLLCAEKDK
jgi:SAM-dependent methyltransferase